MLRRTKCSIGNYYRLRNANMYRYKHACFNYANNSRPKVLRFHKLACFIKTVFMEF